MPPDVTGFTPADLDYELPEALIAQQPAARRGDARLLVLSRASGGITHATVERLAEFLRSHDLLVLNDTRVLAARFLARRATGGAVPGLFLREEDRGRWRVLLRGSARLRPGETLTVTAPDRHVLRLTLRTALGNGEWEVRADPPGDAETLLTRFGYTPLPPYIRRPRDGGELDAVDRQRYQTVYARRPGAVAAPTAGLHLTPEFLASLPNHRVNTAFVTLHVGAGTFKPIAAQRLADHVMHEEWFDLPAAAAEAILRCRRQAGRVVAVGTTSARVLESAVTRGTNEVTAQSGATRIFIYPPYRFAVVDALLTNFHLPRSTLLAMVMAFAGVEPVRRAYREAVADRYRFYSYGDAMLIV